MLVEGRYPEKCIFAKAKILYISLYNNQRPPRYHNGLHCDYYPRGRISSRCVSTIRQLKMPSRALWLVGENRKPYTSLAILGLGFLRLHIQCS